MTMIVTVTINTITITITIIINDILSLYRYVYTYIYIYIYIYTRYTGVCIAPVPSLRGSCLRRCSRGVGVVCRTRVVLEHLLRQLPRNEGTGAMHTPV